MHPTPDTTPAEALLAEGYDRSGAGDAAGAEAAFRRALAADPGLAEAAGALADLLAADGRAAEAASLYAAALAGDPGRRDWRRGRAEALAAAGEADAALAEAEALVTARPDDAAARRLLARLHLDRGDAAQALDHAREAAFLDPHGLEGVGVLAACQLAAGDPLAAAEALDPALRRAHPMDPERPRALVLLGRAWTGLGEPEKAAAALRAALEADEGDAAGAGPLLAALEAGGQEGLSAAYVRALFDRYADRFDTDLTVKLRYAAPRLLGEALARVGLLPGAELRVLDAGCGTGLAGPELRPLARHLAGVDLAPRMVDRARARGIYDDLWAGDLLEAFGRVDAAWDLIAAADVLVYLGDLAPVMEAAAAALTPGGRFAATVERLEGDGGFVLQPKRRYAHSEAHLREAAARAGLAMELLEPVAPRWEGGKPVSGLLFVARKP